MKRLLLALVLAASTAQAATVPQIKATIDNFWTNNSAKFVNRQNDYFALHGHYWQGIVTPTTRPDNGATVPADYTKRPTDHADTWAMRFSGAYVLPNSLPCQISVDVYDGPLGKGWTVSVYFTKDATLYWKTWNYGPETGRQHDWKSKPA